MDTPIDIRSVNNSNPNPAPATPADGNPATPEPAQPAPATDERTEAGTPGQSGQPTPAQPTGGHDNDTPGGQPEDYKTKFSESTRENQRLAAILKKQGIDPETGNPTAPQGDPAPAADPDPAPAADPQPQPAAQPPAAPARQNPLTVKEMSDTEIEKSVPGFLQMNENEKNLIRDTKKTAQLISGMQEVVTTLYQENQFNKDLKKILKEDKFSPLKEHLDEFEEYAFQDGNLEKDINDLAILFMHNKGMTAQPAAPATPAAPPTPTNPGVEPSSGAGAGGGKTASGYTAEELADLRQNDPKRYQKLAREGKLKMTE